MCDKWKLGCCWIRHFDGRPCFRRDRWSDGLRQLRGFLRDTTAGEHRRRVGRCRAVAGIWRVARMRGVWPPVIEKGEVALQAAPHSGDAFVGVQIDLFVFDGAPQAFDEHVVTPAASPSMLI